jgi:hypothetical protein
MPALNITRTKVQHRSEAAMQETTTIDRTGILIFLIMTFGATTAVSIILWSRGVSLAEPSIEGQLAVAGAMFFPGISSLIARRLRGEGLEDAGLRWGARGLYTQAYLVILIIFTAAFGLTAALFVRPDFSLSAFSQRYGIALPSSPGIVLLAVFLASITVG